MARHLFLSGFMGVGKSTVGALVATRLQLPFVDLDRRVEESAGQSIAGIFQTEGELGFRSRERQALRTVAAELPSVVAVGGGAFVDEGSRGLAREVGLLLTLTARPETLRARMARQPGTRPLAAQAGELLAARASVYADCDETVATDGKSPVEVAREVVALVSGRLD